MSFEIETAPNISFADCNCHWQSTDGKQNYERCAFKIRNLAVSCHVTNLDQFQCPKCTLNVY